MSAYKTFEQVTGKAANGFHQSDVPDLRGKTAVVTGGTGGIGFEVARALALGHARVLLLSRKTEHGEEAVEEIKESGLQHNDIRALVDVVFIECDLGDLNSVKAAASKIAQEEERLDILICDAGVGVNKFDTAATGIDRHFSVNHLGHFYLVNQLLPLLHKTASLPNVSPPRVVVVSSELHRAAPSNTQFASVAELNDADGMNGSLGQANSLYARTKLASILFVKEFIKRAKLNATPSGEPLIYAIATHPGAVHTGQQDQFKEAYGGIFGTILKSVVVPFMRSPEQGSLSTLWAAVSPDVVNTSPSPSKEEKGNGKYGWQGRYITDPGQDGKESDQARDMALAERLWTLSEGIVKEQLGQDALHRWDE